jgi:hypothetical protein
MMRRADKATAYLLWALCIFGVCGLHRLYAGQVVWGIVYFITFGFFFVGQLVDLLLIPGMINRRNAELRQLHWAKYGEDVLAPGTAPEFAQGRVSALATPQPQAVESPLQQLLKVAHAQGGTLSEAQIALHTGLSPAEIKPVLQEAMRLGYADVVNDPDTGAIRYVFDV